MEEQCISTTVQINVTRERHEISHQQRLSQTELKVIQQRSNKFNENEEISDEKVQLFKNSNQFVFNSPMNFIQLLSMSLFIVC